jgi:CPA2 family monovalent cation:H+ antiporter-2
MGQREGLVPPEETGVILASALITILLTPFVYASAAPLYQKLNAVPALSHVLNRHSEKESFSAPPGPAPRVLILGCGRVGKHVSQALSARDIPHIVVDYDADVIARLRGVGVPVVYGDATSEIVLAKATPPSVELAVVALPEAGMTPIAVGVLQRLKPDLPIIARVHHGAYIPRVRAAGADEVVHAEFEAATSIIRHGLTRLGCPEDETEAYIEEIRRVRYRGAEGSGL